MGSIGDNIRSIGYILRPVQASVLGLPLGRFESVMGVTNFKTKPFGNEI